MTETPIRTPSNPARGQPARLASEYSGAVGKILARVQAAYPKYIDLSLDRLTTLLHRLGNPERALPPVIHVAGTNGKGSTCAFIRTLAEARQWRVHVMTSPHLVSVTERFRLAGKLVQEDRLAATLEEVEAINGDAPITVFEILTAAGFLLFAREPADLAIIEVGLGGRLDATNVVSAPLASVITPIGLDHQSFLGDSITEIAREKAGVIKPHCPIISAAQDAAVTSVIEAEAMRVNAPLWMIGRDVTYRVLPDGGMAYTDPHGDLTLPAPGLVGQHQYGNAALAIAALRRAASDRMQNSDWAAITQTQWPGRLQKLSGSLLDHVPPGWEIWLDGGHNPHASHALLPTLQKWRDRPLHLLIGMKSSKDIEGFIRPLLPYATSVHAVMEPDQYDAISVADIVAASGHVALPGPDILGALKKLSGATGRVLICGSLYLAGAALRRDKVAERV